MDQEILEKKKFQAVGKASTAMFWPRPSFTGRPFDTSGFSDKGNSISASGVPTAEDGGEGGDEENEKEMLTWKQ